MVALRFGGGIHSRASPDTIDPRECASGQNFVLDLENHNFRNRKPFDLIGTVPNGASILGFATLLKSDGTVSFLVQAGATVYEWDGATTFTSKGTVAAAAKLRGRMEHNWQLSDKVLITDINQQQPLMEWDGTTLQNVSHNLGGDFFARYCFVSNERAWYGNVKSGSATPHMIVGAKRGDYTNLSVTDRPSASLGAADPFFLLTPDLRPINGLVEAFGLVTVSTEFGSIYSISGADATDFAVSQLYPQSGASGYESLAYIGNDVVYGRQGRIETISDTNRYGDVETDDLSVSISDLIEGYTGWTAVYNARVQRVYLFPDSQAECWVYQKAMRGKGLSPWMKWTTQHAVAFQPSAVMNMYDPSDGLEYVFFGDSSGNLYRMEGSGTSGDGGSAAIQSDRTSVLFSTDSPADVYNFKGHIRYLKNEATTLTLTARWAGESVVNESITITIPAITGDISWGGDWYFGGEYYWNTPFAGRFARQNFGVGGRSNEFQIYLSAEGTGNFEINEIGFEISEG
ncbi:MAG: hypothetical protein ACE5FS_10155 [Paracoccaceae bacterium]